MVPARIPIVIPNWYRKYKSTSNVLGVRSVNLLSPVNNRIRILKKITNAFAIPWMSVYFKRTKVITVTEIASTVRNPVFIPKIKKIEEIISLVLPADTLERSIFSGEEKRGTLKIAFTKNTINREIDTVLIWFWRRGNLTSIARPRIIPWNIPIPKALKTAINWIIGSCKISTRNGIRGNTS